MKIKFNLLLIMILFALSIISCKPSSSKSEWELDEERQAEWRIIEDSLRLEDHKRINDSLIMHDKGYLTDNIYLGMEKSKFDNVMNKVHGRIEVAGVKLDFDTHSMNFGSDNKLHVFSLKTKYDVHWNEDTTLIIDQSQDYVDNLVEFFSKKYGEPDSTLNDEREFCKIEFAYYILWLYSTRIIEISNPYGAEELSVKIFDPAYYKGGKDVLQKLSNRRGKE